MRRPGGLPDTHVPDDAELLAAVRRRPGAPASLRAICAAVWSELPWTAVTPGRDSAQRPRPWPAGPDLSAAEWLRAPLDTLVRAGSLRHGAADRTEVDALAGITYLAPEDGP